MRMVLLGICYIFGAAEGLPEKFEKKSDDIVIAADGGYRFLKENSIVPDIVLGDFDSLGFVPDCPCEIIKHPVKKNDTDTMLAVKTGFLKGYNDFVLYGCAGKRLDHTFANIQTLAFIVNNGGKGFLKGVDFALTLLKNGGAKFDKSCSGNISVFSVSEKSVGVNIKGLLYETENEELTYDFPLGVSNEFIGKEAEISVEEGIIALIWSGEIGDIEL